MSNHPFSAHPRLSPRWRSQLSRGARGSLALLALSGSLPMLGALQAQALPKGPQIERGKGTVTGDADRMTVRTNGRTVISWQNFNIEAGKLVDFQNDKAVLNYVRLGGGPSRIDGNMRATNPIILLNNQGITVGRTALISVPSLLLSTGSLLPDSIDKFIQGVNYGNGLNAPLISIQLSNGDGPIAIEGAIRSTNGGGIGLIAPSITIAPTATLFALGSRNAATGTDGVNIAVNGVDAKGSLWLGTTGLPLSAYTKPIAGMPGAALPTLPTGFGFTQVGGQPSPQRIELALQASYDLERVVIGSSGALPGQFDGLFFSPNFRVTDFYVYDGIEAVEEGHRQATVGGLRRTLVNVQTNQLIDDQLESTILGLLLPPGASLMAATDINLDANGQLLSGNLVITPPPTLSRDFVDQFGNGAFTLKIAGGQGSLEGSNGTKASYNPTTGQVSWVRSVQGPPITETVRVPGVAIAQGSTAAPTGLVQGQATTTQYIAREGYYYHGRTGTYAGTSACSGCRYMNPVTGQVSYWKGHFSSDSNGHQHFVQDPRGSSVVYAVGGQFYVTDAATFDPKTTPRTPPSGGTSFTPDTLQTITRPGPTTQVSYSEILPIRGNAPQTGGAAQSSWVRPTPPPSQILTPPLAVLAPTAAPPLPPYGIPEPTPPVPNPTPGVVTAAERPRFSGSNPVIQPQQGPGISGYAPYAEPSPTVPVPTPAPTLAPTPTQAVPTPRPSLVPQPTPSPPVEVPTARPTLAPTPTQAVPTPRPSLVPQPTPSAPVQVPTARPTAAPTPTQAVPTPGPGLIPQPTPSASVGSPTPRPTSPAGTTTGGGPTPTPGPGANTVGPTPQPPLVPMPTLPVPTTPRGERPTSGTVPAGTARQPVTLRPEISVPSPGAALQTPGLTLTYQVPRSVVEASIPGGIASRSRASLPDGRPLPAELDYDPTSQTFTVTNTELLPLPLDVMLRMPTRDGGEGSVTLTIGRP